MKEQILAPLSWVEWLAEFERRLLLSGQSRNTNKLRSYHLRRFAHELGVPPPEVCEQHILDHLDKPEWSAAYRRSVLGSLRAFFKWARLTGRIVQDPAENTPSIKVKLTLPRPASDAAVRAGMHAKDPRVRLMTRLGNEAALRCCEIAAVASRDVLGHPGQRMLLVHGKGGRERVVPISDALADELLESDGHVFPGKIDGHLSAGYVSKLISRAMAGVGTGHPLRHRAATEWLNVPGANLRIVQELLGHASVATTQIYTLVTNDQKRDIISRRAA